MQTVSETLRALIQDREHRTAVDAGLDRRVIREFSRGTKLIRSDTIDALAEFFGLELKPKTKPKGRAPAGRKSKGPKSPPK